MHHRRLSENIASFHQAISPNYPGLKPSTFQLFLGKRNQHGTKCPTTHHIFTSSNSVWWTCLIGVSGIYRANTTSRHSTTRNLQNRLSSIPKFCFIFMRPLQEKQHVMVIFLKMKSQKTAHINLIYKLRYFVRN